MKKIILLVCLLIGSGLTYGAALEGTLTGKFYVKENLSGIGTRVVYEFTPNFSRGRGVHCSIMGSKTPWNEIVVMEISPNMIWKGGYYIPATAQLGKYNNYSVVYELSDIKSKTPSTNVKIIFTNRTRTALRSNEFYVECVLEYPH